MGIRLETLNIYRPIKVKAWECLVITVILLVTTISTTTDWMQGWREGLFTLCIGIFLTGLGIGSSDPNRKYKYYSVGTITLAVSGIVLTLAAIIYPLNFWIGWGVAWVSIILIFVSTLLVFCDRESEEIFYRKIYVEEEGEGDDD